MYSHNPHLPGWSPYHQKQGGNAQQNENQGYSNHNNRARESQNQGGEYKAGYGLPIQDTAIHRPGSGQYNPDSTCSAYSYHNASPDMQYMMQMMINLRSQMDQLNQLIARNNQLLQSIQNQEDTKCVQGSGGGAVIVRM